MRAMTDASDAAKIGARVADDLHDLPRDGRWHWWTWGTNEALVRSLDVERYCAVVPMVFTWAVIVGKRVHVMAGYSDRWCYQRLATAIAAATEWDGTGEPDGWHRHPITGRRRPDGDAAHEYVER